MHFPLILLLTLTCLFGVLFADGYYETYDKNYPRKKLRLCPVYPKPRKLTWKLKDFFHGLFKLKVEKLRRLFGKEENCFDCE